MSGDFFSRYALTRQRPIREDLPPTSPFVKTLGVVAIALGVGVVGAYVLDYHRHSCPSCGHRWRHFGAFNMGDETAHTCTHCGNKQWWKDSPRAPQSHVHATSTKETPEAFHESVNEPPQGA